MTIHDAHRRGGPAQWSSARPTAGRQSIQGRRRDAHGEEALSASDTPTRRNSLRYPGYDYRQAGAVFVTMCTHNRQRLFGEIVDGAVVLSPSGTAAECYWLGIPERFPGVLVDAFVIMPDHLHGILLMGTDPDIETEASVSVSDIIRWYKVCMRGAYRKHVADSTWEPYQSSLWHRQFNDRIIRHDLELAQTQDYIAANPARWQERMDARSVSVGADPRSGRPPGSPLVADRLS